MREGSGNYSSFPKSFLMKPNMPFLGSSLGVAFFMCGPLSEVDIEDKSLVTGNLCVTP